MQARELENQIKQMAQSVNTGISKSVQTATALLKFSIFAVHGQPQTQQPLASIENNIVSP